MIRYLPCNALPIVLANFFAVLTFPIILVNFLHSDFNVFIYFDNKRGSPILRSNFFEDSCPVTIGHIYRSIGNLAPFDFIGSSQQIHSSHL